MMANPEARWSGYLFLPIGADSLLIHTYVGSTSIESLPDRDHLVTKIGFLAQRPSKGLKPQRSCKFCLTYGLNMITNKHIG